MSKSILFDFYITLLQNIKAYLLLSRKTLPAVVPEKGYIEIKESRENEILPSTPLSIHEKAKLVLFYNPSIPTTRRATYRSFESERRRIRGKRWWWNPSGVSYKRGNST